MSFWSQLNANNAGSVPPPRDHKVQPSSNSNTGYETDEDHAGESPPPAVLSPQMPPPTHDVFQHHPSPVEKTQSPHRGPPFDPVFKAAEGTFPTMTVPNVGQNQSSNVHIFDPSVQGNVNVNVNVDQQIEVVDSAPAEDPTTTCTNKLEHASDKAAISDKTPPEPLPPPSISRATRRVPPPPPPRPPPKVVSAEVETNSLESEGPPPPVESESSDNDFGSTPAKMSQMFTPTVDRFGRKGIIAGGESSFSANHHHQMVLFETPNRVIRPSPKFVFLSDQKMVPANIKRLEETTMKRRREMMARMKELDCRLARLVSNFAEEKMDLDLAISDTLDRSICHPLEASVERLTVERQSSTERGPALLDIEKILSALDNEMAKHLYVNMSDAKRDELDSLFCDLHQEIIPSMRLEDSKSDKIEGGVVRRFENVAGVAARQFHQEAAARRASVEFVKKQSQAAVEKEHQQGDDVLNTIKELREQVHRERLQRQADDKIILDEIIRTTVTMKRAMLSAVSPGK
jgi:hypothetical protein